VCDRGGELLVLANGPNRTHSASRPQRARLVSAPKMGCPATTVWHLGLLRQPVVRSQRHNVIAICFIFDAGCSCRGAVAGGGPWGGCVDSGDTCGVLLKLSNRFLGAAVAGARFFFGFRPRLLGIGVISGFARIR
jgi:hypothetical protein